MKNFYFWLGCILAAGCANQVRVVEPGPIVLEVWKNQQLVTRAGTDDLGVLNVIVDAIGPLGKDSVSRCNVERCMDKPAIMLSAGGLTNREDASTDEFLNWLDHEKLQVGDVIEIKIRNDIEPDPVKTRLSRVEQEKMTREWTKE